MKKFLITAAALVLGLAFAPAAYAENLPSPDASGDSAGTVMEHVNLDSMPSGASDVVVNPASPAPTAPSTAELNAGGNDVDVPAGPEVMYPQAPASVANAEPQIHANVAPQAPANATGKTKTSISAINANAPQAFVSSPINSIPGVVSFIFIMLLCVGSGVAAAVVISIVTGKKINLGLRR
ncbi:fibronectin-binding protein [uncultured Mobiluncus sp.]|uniref:fibronectin-binding protein n=1 Tax=uncultured Mobiluncus sp. TaxID=293425 RepID=UPI0025FC1946|nr:fibronectin-binding protein [uncultured Mobiluncus sp.]